MSDTENQNNVGIIVGISILFAIVILCVAMTRFIRNAMKQVINELNCYLYYLLLKNGLSTCIVVESTGRFLLGL